MRRRRLDNNVKGAATCELTLFQQLSSTNIILHIISADLDFGLSELEQDEE